MKSRILVPEWMDDPSLEVIAHRRALNGLRRINKISRTSSTIAQSIMLRCEALGLTSARILDLGCGCGDVAYGVVKRLPVDGRWSMEGWDISATAIDYARQLHGNASTLASLISRNPENALSFHRRDVFQADGPQFDFVYCSLFLHHFTDSDAIRVLRRMRELARHGVIVDDLNRSRLGLWMAYVAVRLLSRSPVVRFDGPQSVRAAFTMLEIQPLARAAGLAKNTLVSRWPGRWLLNAEISQ